jgi:phosphate transport system substrate-binding protein
MDKVMGYWAEGFRKIYPNVKLEVEGKGSSTAPPALMDGRSTFGPMSREMKSAEIDDFKQKFGYEPVGLRTSIDMLAVFVHKDNPIRGLDFKQVDAIFSETRAGGYDKRITTWGDVGLTGEWADKPIRLYGRNSASGTYAYFKQHALFGGDFNADVKEQPGSSAVVQGVESDKYGIGYSGIGYSTAGVRAIALAREGDDYVPAESDNAYSGAYPLARFLYLYVNHQTGSTLDPLRREFARYIFSQGGQQDVIKGGFLPVTARIAKSELAKVGLEIQIAEAGAKR